VGPLNFKDATNYIWRGPIPRVAEVFPNRRQATGKIGAFKPTDTGNNLIASKNSSPILLLISDHQTRNYLWKLLVENHFSPRLMADQEELLRVLKENQFSVVLIDCGAVSCYGARIISKIKVVCQRGRIIVLCDKTHLCDSRHRGLIKEILAIGVYACIVAPYEEWEVFSLVTYDSQREKK
jgi:PleD family two-component response regulator